MRIAISGANGLIGSTLTTALRDLSHECVPIRRVRQGGVADDSTPSIAWDPQSGLVSPQDLSGFDVVIHLAGRSIGERRWSTGEKDLIRDSRVQATQCIAEQLAQLKTPPPLFISASATGIYGDCGEELLDESRAHGADFLSGVAHEWEAACDPLREAGVRVIHPRFGIVCSPAGGALKKMLGLFRMGLGGKLGSGNQYWSWISLIDCVRALVWLLEHENAEGPYNLVAPISATNREFTRALASALNRPAFLSVPKFALRLALGEMADALLFSSCRVEPARLLAEGFQFEHSKVEDYFNAEFRDKHNN